MNIQFFCMGLACFIIGVLMLFYGLKTFNKSKDNDDGTIMSGYYSMLDKQLDTKGIIAAVTGIILGVIFIIKSFM